MKVKVRSTLILRDLFFHHSSLQTCGARGTLGIIFAFFFREN
jgi:hypothetical protein